jgi:hypothetical protein
LREDGLNRHITTGAHRNCTTGAGREIESI